MAVPNVQQRLDIRNSQLFSQSFDSSKQSSEQFSVNLRKKKRLENSIQKRFKPQISSESTLSRFELFHSSFNQLESSDLQDSALLKISEVLSSAGDVGLTSDHLKAFLHLLQSKKESKSTQLVLTNILINLTFHHSEFNEDLVRGGVFSVLSPFLSMHRAELCRNAIWVLTNLMIETKALKARFVTTGLLECLLELIQIKTVPVSTVSTAMWALSSFAEQVLKLSEENLKILISILKDRLDVLDEKVLGC